MNFYDSKYRLFDDYAKDNIDRISQYIAQHIDKSLWDKIEINSFQNNAKHWDKDKQTWVDSPRRYIVDFAYLKQWEKDRGFSNIGEMYTVKTKFLTLIIPEDKDITMHFIKVFNIQDIWECKNGCVVMPQIYSTSTIETYEKEKVSHYDLKEDFLVRLVKCGIERIEKMYEKRAERFRKKKINHIKFKIKNICREEIE